MPKVKHQMHGTPTYKSWQSMKDRCSNPNATSYCYYGALGIGFPESWFFFESFLEDMGLRPEGMSLDRINSQGPYSKENCRWQTPKQQANNRTNNVLVAWHGELMTIDQMAEFWKVNKNTARGRVRRFFKKTDNTYEQYRRIVVRKGV